MAQESSIKSRGPIAAHPVTSAVIAILVIAAIFFSLYVPLYARATPMVGDFPFFYFYLIVYMPVVGIVLWIVITLQKRLAPARGAPDGPAGVQRGGASDGAGEVTQ
jgi:membrane protein implicated in regulation of membrane protease activity